MQVYIETDMEGISGICSWKQTREPDNPLHQEARRLLMADINAAVEGCLEAGATRVYVNDGHGGGFNVIPEMMHPGAEWVTGGDRVPRELCMDEPCDVAMLLGYHAMAGTSDGILRHTQSSRSGNRYWYNGRECGEIVQSALVLGHFGIPVGMVTGDEATCREARNFLGETIVTVAVKKGYSAQYARLLAPKRAHDLIRRGAKEMVERATEFQPFAMDMPIRGILRFPDKSTADGFRPRRAARRDDYSFEATFECAADIYYF